jgi:hypothetical protein
MDTPIRDYVFTVKVDGAMTKIHSAGKTRFLARKNLIKILEESHLPAFEVLDEEQPVLYRVDFTYSIVVKATNEDEAAYMAYEKLDRNLSEGAIPAAAFAASDKVVRLP